MKERKFNINPVLTSSQIDTPLGSMLAIGDDKVLYFLLFADQHKLKRKIDRLLINYNIEIISGVTEPIKSMEQELELYFTGKLRQFKTPLYLFGTAFQQLTWQALISVPYGKTNSYADLASFIAKPLAYRAVANANAANRLAIVVPCHRIINNNGALGGYDGGIERKKQLLDLEKKYYSAKLGFT